MRIFLKAGGMEDVFHYRQFRKHCPRGARAERGLGRLPFC